MNSKCTNPAPHLKLDPSQMIFLQDQFTALSYPNRYSLKSPGIDHGDFTMILGKPPCDVFNYESQD